MKYLWIYLCTINALSFLLMLIDKQKAKKNKWRIPEKTLLILSALGGSVAMLITMLLIRHKTKHFKFMVGIPVIIIAQIAIIAGAHYLFI